MLLGLSWKSIGFVLKKLKYHTPTRDSVYITHMCHDQQNVQSTGRTLFSLTERNLINVSNVAVGRRADGHFKAHRTHSWTRKEAGSALNKHEFLFSR